MKSKRYYEMILVPKMNDGDRLIEIALARDCIEFIDRIAELENDYKNLSLNIGVTSMTPHCNRCLSRMAKSTAFANDDTYMGVSDFPGEPHQRGQTISTDRTKADRVPCWKCTVCGHSFRIISKDAS